MKKPVSIHIFLFSICATVWSSGCGRIGFDSALSDTDSTGTDTGSGSSPDSSSLSGSDTFPDTVSDSGTADTGNDTGTGSDGTPTETDTDVIGSETTDTDTMDTSSGSDSGSDTGTATTDTDTTDTDSGSDSGSDIDTETADTDTYLVVGDGTDATHATLEEAIDDANLNTVDSIIITFEPDWTENLTTDLPTIGSDISIVGDNTIIDAAGADTPGTACLKILGDNVTVTGLTVQNCESAAISVTQSSGIQISGNTFDGNFYAFSCQEGLSPSDTVFGPDNIVLNTAYDGIYATCDGIEIRYNQFFNTGHRAIAVEADGGSIIGNLAIGTSALHPDVDIINNSTNWTVWHNTLAGVSSNAITISDASSGHNVSNNILAFATYWGISTGNASVTAENNLFYNNGSSPPCDNACSSQTNPILHTDATDDTVFVDAGANDYHLISGSPAVNAGVDLGMSYYVNTADIGCFESNY